MIFVGFSLINFISHSINSVASMTSIEKQSNTNNPEMSEPEKGIFIFDSVNIKDKDSANFNGGKLTVAIINAMADDILWIHSQSANSGEIGIDGSNLTYKGENIGSLKGGQGNIQLEVSFNEKATPEAAQILLRNIKYTSIAKQPVVGTRKVQFQISDGGENGIKKSPVKNINVIAENQAPTISIPGNISVKENTSIFINGFRTTDADSQNITVSLNTSKGILIVKRDTPNGLNAKNIINNKSHNVTLTGTAVQINATLADPKGIIYQAEKESTGNDTIAIQAKDNGKVIPSVSTKTKALIWPSNATEAKTVENRVVNITVLPIKPPPIIGIAETNKTAKENTDLMITGINITDPNSPKQTVILSTQNGAISVKDKVPQGLTVKEINQDGSKTVTLTGTINQINATLADPEAVIYKGDRDFSGEDILNVTARNDANKVGSKQISIKVSHINQPPEITESETVTTNNTDIVSSITNKEIENLINGYLKAKSKIFGREYDKNIAARFLTGEAYNKRITSSTEGSLEWLQKHNAYYQYGVQTAKLLKQVATNNEKVNIDVFIDEKLTYYEPGKDPRPPKINKKKYRAILVKDNNIWKISYLEPS
jgi:hypothetical protein